MPPVLSLSREERELMIAANNGYLLAFDNLSTLLLPPTQDRAVDEISLLNKVAEQTVSGWEDRQIG